VYTLTALWSAPAPIAGVLRGIFRLFPKEDQNRGLLWGAIAFGSGLAVIVICVLIHVYVLRPRWIAKASIRDVQDQIDQLGNRLEWACEAIIAKEMPLEPTKVQHALQRLAGQLSESDEISSNDQSRLEALVKVCGALRVKEALPTLLVQRATWSLPTSSSLRCALEDAIKSLSEGRSSATCEQGTGGA